ncbi:MAG TPA: hypothetical protein VEF03_10675 [Candidatus Binataceae bacterium]|nr:hypothetical protein [Candidatus Binataceae bacterium]
MDEKYNPFPWLPFWPKLGPRLHIPSAIAALIVAAALIWLCVRYG